MHIGRPVAVHSREGSCGTLAPEHQITGRIAQQVWLEVGDLGVAAPTQQRLTPEVGWYGGGPEVGHVGHAFDFGVKPRQPGRGVTFAPVRRAKEKRNFSQGVVDGGLKAAEHDIGASFAHQVVQPSLSDGSIRWARKRSGQRKFEVFERGKIVLDVFIDSRVQQSCCQLVKMIEAQRFNDEPGSHCEGVCGLTFELRSRRRTGAWPAGRMMTASASQAKCRAGGGPAPAKGEAVIACIDLRRGDEPQLAQSALQLADAAPGKNGRVLALVGRVGRKRLRPPAAAYQWKKRAFVQPGKTDLGEGAGTAPDDEAGIAGKRHEKVSRVTHATRDHDCGRPIRGWHFVGGNDAEDQATSGNRALSSHARSGTSAATDYGDAVTCQECAGLAGKFVCGGTGFGTAQHTDLWLADGGG